MFNRVSDWARNCRLRYNVSVICNVFSQKSTSDKQYFFPLFSELCDKLGESDKNQESGRQHEIRRLQIKLGGLECLLYIEVHYIEVLFHTIYCNFGQAEKYHLLLFNKL